MKDCKKCGASLGDSSSYCQTCGTAVKKGFFSKSNKKDDMAVGIWKGEQEEKKPEMIEDEIEDETSMSDVIEKNIAKPNRTETFKLDATIAGLSRQLEDHAKRIEVLTNELKWLIDNQINWATAYFPKSNTEK